MLAGHMNWPSWSVQCSCLKIRWILDYSWPKVTESYPIEFVLHVSYSLFGIGIHVIAPFTRLPAKRPDWPVSPTPLVFNAPGGGVPLGRSSWNFARSFPNACTKWCKNIAEKFNRLCRVHERHRQTTDRRQTPLPAHYGYSFDCNFITRLLYTDIY